MNEFANSNVTSVDGRLNKEAVPEEIYAYGFKPPVQTPDGVWTAGDELPANWLNFLLNDLYKGAVTKNLTPATAPANQVGYYAVQIGDVLIQGGTFISNPSNSNPVLMVFPTPFEAGSSALVLGHRTQTNAVASALISSVDVAPPNTPATAIMWTATASGAAVPVTNLQWTAIGHLAANSGGVPQGLRDLRTHKEFCENSMTYPDGQENTGQPGTLTVAQGFAPPVNNAGVWTEGDGLSAQALNFLMRDLYRMPPYSGIAGGHARSGAVEFGGFLMQWAIVSGSGNSYVWNFAIPFANGDPSVVAFDVQGYTATPPPTEQAFAATVGSSITATKAEFFLTRTVSSGGVVKAAESFFVVAVGLSSRQAVPSGDDLMVLDSFAKSSITYPDGQPNKVQPSTQQIANGFTFEAGAAQGDFMTANKLNWLLRDLYMELGFKTLRATFQPPGYTTAWPQITFRLGRFMVQSGRVRMGDLAGTAGKIIFRDAFGASPTIHLTQRYDNVAPAIGVASNARYATVQSVTTTDATVQARAFNGAAVGNATTDNYTFDWVAIGLAPV